MSADSLGTASRCALHVKILSRVPYRSLCCFKCISRSWLILCGSDPIRTSARNCLSWRRRDQPQLLPVPQSFWERPAAGLPLSWASHWFCPDSSASPVMKTTRPTSVASGSSIFLGEAGRWSPPFLSQPASWDMIVNVQSVLVWTS